MTDNMKTGVYTFDDEDSNFNFSTTISAGDKMVFVKAVTDLLFDIDGNYYSIAKDLIFDFMLVTMFTDIDTMFVLETVDDKDNIDLYDEIEELLDGNSIVDIIKANAESGLIEELAKGVNDNIEYRTGIHKNPISESLSNLIDTLNKKVANFNFDLNDDNVADILKTMTNISEEVNMEKILDAYSKTDMFKNQWANAIAQKNGGGEATLSLLSPTV